MSSMRKPFVSGVVDSSRAVTMIKATKRIFKYKINFNKMLSYRRETALQGTLVLAESGRLELRDNILLIL